MDPTKKAALEAADQNITAAQQALAEAKKAHESADDTKKAETKTALDSATQALADAQKAKQELEGDDVDDLLDEHGKPRVLADGTPADKEVKLPFEKFQELNEKGKLFEQFAPLLAQIQKDPELIKKLMGGDDPNKPIEARLRVIEEQFIADKRAVVKSTIQNAVKTWPDFRAKWKDIQPILTGLEASGVPYADAVQRAYFAVNPDAIKQKERLVETENARDAERRRGSMSPPGGGGGPSAEPEEDEYELNDADKEFARIAGIDPKLYTKHKSYLERFKDLV